MHLSRPFEDRVDAIKEFPDEDGARLLVLRCPPDLNRLLRKVLVNIDRDATFPHMFLYIETPFESYTQSFVALAEEIDRAVAPWRDDLEELGVRAPVLLYDRRWLEQAEPGELAQRLASYMGELGTALSPSGGRICPVLETTTISHPDAFVWWIEALTVFTPGDGTRYVVIDESDGMRFSPLLERLDSARYVDFQVPPEELENAVDKALADPELDRAERRRYLVLAGSMAASGGKAEEAVAHLTMAEQMCAEDGKLEERAAALYNLGNSFLQQSRLEEAQKAYEDGAEICLNLENDNLLAMILTNLGVTLHRQELREDAQEVFKAARSLFVALTFKPGEAHVLDCMARAYLEDGMTDPAEDCWTQALEIYEGISAEHLYEVRTSGADDIREKLASIGASPPASTDA